MGNRPKADEIQSLTQPVEEALSALQALLPEQHQLLLVPISTYLAVSSKVLSQTNPSKIRDATRVVWIKGLMDHGKSFESECNQLHNELDKPDSSGQT